MAGLDEDANNAYNKSIIETGQWIDRQFLKEVLEMTLNEEVYIHDFNITPAVGEGDNYLSILYKTKVRFTTNGSKLLERHMMIKGVPTVQVLYDMIEQMGIFSKEITMYNKCLTAMHRFLREHFSEGTPHVAPDSYICSRPKTIVMEDLTQDGYKMVNRQNQLDLEHSLVTLQTLARFHALTLKLYEENPELVKSVATEFYAGANREMAGPMIDACYPIFASVLETWGEAARFAPVIREAGQYVWEKIEKLTEPSAKFNVLNHGDMWMNNILYKYNNDGTVTNAKLVDFQLARYTTPAMDLHYFFFTSVQAKVLTENMVGLLEAYHNDLMANISVLGLDVDYSLEQLQEDMREKAAFGLQTLTQILPIVLAPPSQKFDAESTEPSEDHSLTKNYKNPAYKETAIHLLTYMENFGYLDEANMRMKSVVDTAKILEAAKEEQGVKENTGALSKENQVNANNRGGSARSPHIFQRLRMSILGLLCQPMCQ